MIGIDDNIVDLETLFDFYHLDNITPLGGEELSANCPFHDEDVDHHFSMNRETGLWNCFVCSQRGTIIDFVCLMDKCSLGMAKKFLMQIASYNLNISTTKLKDKISNLITGVREQEVVYIPYEKGVHPYLLKRGFKEIINEVWEVGFSKYLNRIVIPVKDERDELKGYIFRAPNDLTKPKYLYAEGEWKKGLLFGMNRVDNYRQVIVVEGSLDVIWLWQLGFQAVALLGSSISDRQAELLNRFNKVILMLDNDAAGITATYGDNKVGDKVSKYTMVFSTRYPEGRKDPQECSFEDVQKMLDDYKSYVKVKSKMKARSGL